MPRSRSMEQSYGRWEGKKNGAQSAMHSACLNAGVISIELKTGEQKGLETGAWDRTDD